MSDIRGKIREIVAREAEIDPDSVRPESTMEDLGITSVDLVQIIFALEEEFDIYLQDDDLGYDVANMGEVYEAVERMIAGKEG